jgi:outer membrane protein
MLRTLPFPSFRRLPLLIALAFGASAQAQSLLDLYSAARGYDAAYQSAKAQFDATLYKAEQAAPKPEEGAPGAGAAGASKDKVVDAEFEEVDPNKKKPS